MAVYDGFFVSEDSCVEEFCGFVGCDDDFVEGVWEFRAVCCCGEFRAFFDFVFAGQDFVDGCKGVFRVDFGEEASDSHVYCEYGRFGFGDGEACSEDGSVAADGDYKVGLHSFYGNRFLSCAELSGQRVFDHYC